MDIRDILNAGLTHVTPEQKRAYFEALNRAMTHWKPLTLPTMGQLLWWGMDMAYDVPKPKPRPQLRLVVDNTQR